MNFEKQKLIMRAYVVLSNRGKEPVHHLQVRNRTGVARSQVGGVNSFFVGLGFLTEIKRGLYLPTACAVDFFGDDIRHEDFNKLLPCLRESKLFHFIKEQILIHESLGYAQLIKDLLKESDTSEESRVKRALEWLTTAKVIRITQDERVEIVNEIDKQE
jgi:hypothetical protein